MVEIWGKRELYVWGCQEVGFWQMWSDARDIRELIICLQEWTLRIQNSEHKGPCPCSVETSTPSWPSVCTTLPAALKELSTWAMQVEVTNAVLAALLTVFIFSWAISLFQGSGGRCSESVDSGFHGEEVWGQMHRGVRCREPGFA